MPAENEQSRVVIEGVRPQVDGGRFAVKQTAGDLVQVQVDMFADGHDVLAGVLMYRKSGESTWQETPLIPDVNDLWEASFPVDNPGNWEFTFTGWIDRFASWHRDFLKRVAAEQDVRVDLLTGAELVSETVEHLRDQADSSLEQDLERLADWQRRLSDPNATSHVTRICADTGLPRLMARHCPREFATRCETIYPVQVDRERGRFSAWYEMFPRSASPDPSRPGTLRDVQARLPYVASMGFDILYLPPIHPIGRQFRKGPNNAEKAGPGDPGSPWAIGAAEGGHTAIAPELGTLADFRQLVQAARGYDMEIALDIAFQCAPDHPWVRQHPQWFRARPDGTIQYAENPPKKYQDIYPLNFETDDWQALWNALRDVFLYWIREGVKVFRVDNPHTKPFPFWEWCLAEIRQDHPDVLFLAEAFTRPKIMHRLGKLGYSQSYTYFTWRNTKEELTEYLEELTQTDVANFYRPNFWPSTPDILHEQLQLGGRPTFMARLVLAATMTASYGIYGPPYELCWNTPVKEGSEEFLNSEKYQVHHHDLEQPGSLKSLMTQLNTIRKEHQCLQRNEFVQFHPIDNDQLICYSKRSADAAEIIFVAVNLDPVHTQSGFVELPLEDFDLDPLQSYQMHDLLSGARYVWNGPRNYIELSPEVLPAHVFRIRRQVRTERDFEYYE